jgi:hypothetical protein
MYESTQILCRYGRVQIGGDNIIEIFLMTISFKSLLKEPQATDLASGL